MELGLTFPLQRFLKLRFVPYGDPEAFAAALQTLLEQPELRKTMGQTALKKAKTTFDLNKLLEDVYHTYQ